MGNLKLTQDKKALTEFIESLDFRNAVPEMENSETNAFLNQTIEEVSAMKKTLILTLNNL